MVHGIERRMRMAKQFLLLDKSDKSDEGMKFDYAGVLSLVIKSPLDPRAGMDLDEQRKSIRILDKVEAAKTGTMLTLEDADYDFLVSKLKAFKWGTADRRIVELVDNVLDATAPTEPTNTTTPPGEPSNDQ